ncbi:hypothetical protein SRHO_G00335610 [Serrasalmus rhombeus]
MMNLTLEPECSEDAYKLLRTEKRPYSIMVDESNDIMCEKECAILVRPLVLQWSEPPQDHHRAGPHLEHPKAGVALHILVSLSTHSAASNLHHPPALGIARTLKRTVINEKPVMRNLLLIVWLVMFSAAGFGDIVYLSRQRNSSVEFSCMSTNVNAKPFAFSLMRDLVKPEKVLYEHFGNSRSIFNEKDENRFVVRFVDSSHHQVTVNISHLLGRHTDLYRCVFHYDFQKFEDYPGKPKFFLYVEDSTPFKGA